MTDINIASPGASEAALKDALRALTGTGSVIASGSVSTSVQYIDIDLPDTGYQGPFTLILTDFVLSANDDMLSFAFSQDGGATFINDAVDFDSYITYSFSINRSAESAYSAETSSGYNGESSVGTLTKHGNPSDSDYGRGIQATIYPGAVGRRANVLAYASVMGANNWPEMTYATNYCKTAGRVNRIRILPFGNGDAAPPTSGYTIDYGSYLLMGVPE